MKSRKLPQPTPRRERRVFTEEFKRQAVQLMHERRAAGVSVTQIGRELDVNADQLREWARRMSAQDGGLAAAGVVESPEQELKRLRRENARLKEEQAFLKKKSRCTSRGSRGEVRLHRSPSGRARRAAHVCGARSVARGVLRVTEALALGARDCR